MCPPEERRAQLYDRLHLQIGDRVNYSVEVQQALDRVLDGSSVEDALADAVCELVVRLELAEDTLLIQQLGKQSGGPRT